MGRAITESCLGATSSRQLSRASGPRQAAAGRASGHAWPAALARELLCRTSPAVLCSVTGQM